MSASSMAQTEKGNKYIGANIGNVSYTDVDSRTNIGATLTPSAGVFIADNLLLGTGLPLSYARSSDKIGSGKTINRNISYGLTPYGRYYFAGTNAHRFFGQVEGGISRFNYYYNSENSVASPAVQRQNATAFNYGGVLGYNYFLTPGAALEVMAGYKRYDSFNVFDSNRQQSTGVLNVTAGFAVFLPSKLPTTSPAQ